MPGSVHDLTAARAHGVLTSIHWAGLHLYADKGYLSGEAGLRLVPYQGCQLPTSYIDAQRYP